MIVLDTNVISAFMAHEPDARVVAWLDRQAPESVWTTAINVHETRFGLEVMAASRKRRQLEDHFAKALSDPLGGRVLPFDHAAAEHAGKLLAARRRIGRPIEIRDGQIAGIVAARKATLATRNTRHFADLGFALVDPWSA